MRTSQSSNMTFANFHEVLLDSTAAELPAASAATSCVRMGIRGGAVGCALATDNAIMRSNPNLFDPKVEPLQSAAD